MAKPTVFETDNACVRQYWLDESYVTSHHRGVARYLLALELDMSIRLNKMNPEVSYEWVDHHSLLGTTAHLRITVARVEDWEEVEPQMRDVFYRAFPMHFEPSRPDLIKCPGCDLELPRYEFNAQSEHLREHHPEIAADGQRRAGFIRIIRQRIA